MMLLPITSMFAALLTLLLLALSFRIIRLRWQEQVGIGVGDSEPLRVAVRVHGNFIEYVPLALILMGLMELSGASPVLLYLVGGLLFVARIMHAVGLSRSVGVSIYRTIGVLGTFAMLLLSAGYLIGYVVGTHW